MKRNEEMKDWLYEVISRVALIQVICAAALPTPKSWKKKMKLEQQEMEASGPVSIPPGLGGFLHDAKIEFAFHHNQIRENLKETVNGLIELGRALVAFGEERGGDESLFDLAQAFPWPTHIRSVVMSSWRCLSWEQFFKPRCRIGLRSDGNTWSMSKRSGWPSP